jgi:hypothetical protein
MLFAKANDGSAPPANTFKLVAVADGFWELFNRLFAQKLFL